MKTTPPQLIKLAASLVAAGGLLGPAVNGLQAGGFRLPDQDAFATARGEAFVATADNASAVYYNPAGLAQLRGHQIRGGAYTIWYQSQFEQAGGSEWDSEADFHPVPQFFYAYGPESLPLSFGLGVYSPYGLSQEWPQDVPFRQTALKGSVTSLSINPAVAWRALPTLSLGGGITYNRPEADLRQGLFPPPSTGDQFRFEGDGTDWGYNLGVLWQVHSNVFFGFTYRSSLTFDLEGNVQLSPPVVPNGPAQSSLPFPSSFAAGVSWRPTPQWNLEVNVERTDWSKLKSLTVESSFLPPATTPLNWESSYYYEFGITRYLNRGWHVSAGYIFNENSMPEADYNPLVADLDKHFVSAGFGKRNERWGIDFAYQFGFGPEREVSGTASGLADGDYKFVSHALFVTLAAYF